MEPAHHSGLAKAIQLVAEETGCNPEELSGTTRLFHDLGIDGDDADELLQRVASEYQVNFDKFRFSDYFGSEVGAGYRNIIDRMLRKFGFRGYGFTPLTIAVLASAIETGRFEPPPAQSQAASDSS